MQNILAVKTFGNSMIAITTGGTLISWLVFACMDVVTEIWGKKEQYKHLHVVLYLIFYLI